MVMVGISLVSVVACNRSGTNAPVLPTNPTVYVREHWATIGRHYVPVFAMPDPSSDVRTHLRPRQVVALDDKSLAPSFHYGVWAHWYYVSVAGRQGWIFGGDLEHYYSEQRARNAAHGRSNE